MIPAGPTATAVSTTTKLDRLRAILREQGSACIGYSGGVDSVFLAAIAVETLGRDAVLAVTGISAAYPEVQRRVALECAAQFGIPHIEIATDELDDARYAANPSNRCYFCKTELWPKLVGVAAARGLAAVLDGSNADDADDYRPGFAAARENGVRSPLLEAGLTKDEIRALSRDRGLPTWDQPSAPCLASRLPYGVAVTVERLREVEDAEQALRDFGFTEFRVRHHDDVARIELPRSDVARALDSAGDILARLHAAGFARVLVDAEGYRRGALNEALVQIGTPAPSAANEPLPEHDVAGFHRDIAVLHADAATARAAAPALRTAGYRYIAIDLAAHSARTARTR